MKAREIIIINGIEGFRGNGLVRYVLSNSEIGLDELWTLYKSGLTTEEEIKEFYQLIGYSLTGYHEIFPDGEVNETKEENQKFGVSAMVCSVCLSEIEQTGYYEYYCESCEMYMGKDDLVAGGEQE